MLDNLSLIKFISLFKIGWMFHPLNSHSYLQVIIYTVLILCLDDLNYYLIIFISLAIINISSIIMPDKKPRGGPLCDPTSHYFL